MGSGPINLLPAPRTMQALSWLLPLNLRFLIWGRFITPTWLMESLLWLTTCSFRRKGVPTLGKFLVNLIRLKEDKGERLGMKVFILMAQLLLAPTPPLPASRLPLSTQARPHYHTRHNSVGMSAVAGRTWLIAYQEWREGDNRCFHSTPTLDWQTYKWPAVLMLVNMS